MRILLAAAMLAAVAASGCKTAGGNDAALREEAGSPAGAASWTNSRWMASLNDGGHQVEANMEIDDAGGILVANVDGQDHQLPFAGVRAATESELAAFQRDVTNDVLDARGNSVPVTRGLVLVDGGGSFLALLPIVSEQEIVLFPFGPMQRTANAGEEETIECGGLAGTPCPSGKVCKRPPGATADQKGKCVAGNAQQPPVQNPPVPQNNKCGGPGIQCPAPKVCKMPSPPTLHGWGVCVDPPPSNPQQPPTGIPGLGKSCGGFAGGCPTGLRCSSSGFNQPGKCIVDPNAGQNQGGNDAPAADPIEGRSCGGFAGGCPTGYKCTASGFNQTGVCKKSATPPPPPQQDAPQANPDIGRSCGGFAGSCPAPLKCKKNGNGLNATGVCVEP